MSIHKVKKGLILIAILLVPSIVYMLFSLGEHHTAKLGFYGNIDSISDSGDTIYKSIAFPKLMDQKGAELTYEELEGKVLLVDFMNWPCDDACSDKILTLNNYLNKIGYKDQWLLMSIVSNEISPDNLKGLSQKTLYHGDNWVFARCENRDEILALQSAMFLSTQQVNSEEKLPSSKVALLDQSQKIRAFFDLRLQQDNKTMQDAIKLLIQEPHISWKEK